MLHHVSIRTADIHGAIAFYEVLGFSVSERFTTGYTLACWLEGGLGGRLELVQIPEPKPAPDAFGDEHYVGYYHLSFDLGELAENLPNWLEKVRLKFQNLAREQQNPSLNLKVLLETSQQQIGDRLYEVAFISDRDGLPIELIRELS